MTSATPFKRPVALAALFAAMTLSGCAALVSNAASGVADDLSAALLNQDDPATARAAIPSYMVLIDMMVERDPDNPDVLSAAANLYATYGAVFVDDPVRAARLTSRARRYGLAAVCERYSPACDWRSANYDEFVASLDGLEEADAEYLYTYGVSTLAYMRAHSDDMETLAELPQAEALFDRYLALAGDAAEPATHTYLGVLLTLRPPALGGRPDEALAHFRQAIALTDGRDLGAKVEYARGYARLMYDRELHDRLLTEVLDADPYVDGLTLSNMLAQDDARELLAGADDYF
ncbi:MAG TPA: TRAP transporter TatT component family protein [Woeseiaceae bacterium]|nr:TRAP transporter TatT component family protein [Woeseiaceae bacterium]